MDIILQLIQERKVLVAAIGAAVVGLLLGLAIGWWWWPVEWTNATPAYLRSDFQEGYILLVAQDYFETEDLEKARERLGVDFWEEGELAAALEQVEQAQDGQQALAVRKLASDLGTTAVPEGEAEGVGAKLRPVVLVCGIGLLVVAFVGGSLYLYSRLIERREAAAEAGFRPRPAVTEEMAPLEQVTWEGQPPNAQFVTTYVLGDDHYDPSFSIELESGEFMGECGVGISETIGAAAPDRVTALEAWLFDKNDIRTVTKVLMSRYAFNDEALRTKLAPKGEPILLKEGEDVILETKMLRLRVHVVEVLYGEGGLPSDSFFERLTVELAAWVKPGAEDAKARIPVSAPGRM
ncbi:MAG: hypothetical protein PVI07_01020 [Anaerolineae bacterium]|jgi:hypothetical protein